MTKSNFLLLAVVGVIVELFPWSSATSGSGKIPERFMGKWAQVPETPTSDDICKTMEPLTIVRDDVIESYGEDFCQIKATKDLPELSDPRVLVECIAGGEGTKPKLQKEVWRTKKLYGKQIFVEQTPYGILFWQRC